MVKESRKRSLVKAISWRIWATLITSVVVFIFTKKVVLALGIGTLDCLIKLLAYYYHERFWNKIHHGKNIHPLSDIKVKKDLDSEDKQIIQEKLRELGYLDE